MVLHPGTRAHKSTLALDDMVAEKVRQIQPDLIVSDSVAYWGKLTAMKYNIPYVSSTTTFAFNNYSSRYMQRSPGELFKMLFATPKVNRQLKKLRDKGYPVKSILEIVSNDNATNTIVYTSREFQPCADTFSDKYCFVGPSIRPISCEMKKTAEKTIYISMGTVVKNKEIYRNCIETFGNTDYQVILSLGDNGEDYGEVPLVMFPQTPEQGAVAKRVEELGAGKMLASADKETIRNTIETVLSDTKYKAAARDISAGFKRCGGVRAAKEFLENICN